jgi:hypothetical protein
VLLLLLLVVVAVAVVALSLLLLLLVLMGATLVCCLSQLGVVLLWHQPVIHPVIPVATTDSIEVSTEDCAGMPLLDLCAFTLRACDDRVSCVCMPQVDNLLDDASEENEVVNESSTMAEQQQECSNLPIFRTKDQNHITLPDASREGASEDSFRVPSYRLSVPGCCEAAHGSLSQDNSVDAITEQLAYALGSDEGMLQCLGLADGHKGSMSQQASTILHLHGKQLQHIFQQFDAPWRTDHRVTDNWCCVAFS